jgi:hypothetical protein
MNTHASWFVLKCTSYRNPTANLGGLWNVGGSDTPSIGLPEQVWCGGAWNCHSEIIEVKMHQNCLGRCFEEVDERPWNLAAFNNLGGNLPWRHKDVRHPTNSAIQKLNNKSSLGGGHLDSRTACKNYWPGKCSISTRSNFLPILWEVGLVYTLAGK